MNSHDSRGADGGASAGRLLRFGVFEVDLEQQELRRKGVPVKLQQQPGVGVWARGERVTGRARGRGGDTEK